MQNILFLKSKDEGPVDRIINLDLLATAFPNPKGEGTVLIVQGAEITMGMAFDKFLGFVQHHISENYRISNEASAFWHKKRMDDTAEILKAVHNT